MHLPWHETPAAQRALAAIASAPVVTRTRTVTTFALTRDETYAYTGEQADILAALHAAAGEAAMAGDFAAWAESPEPADLIDAALAKRTDAYVVAERTIRDHVDMGVTRWTVGAIVDTTVTEQDGRAHLREAA